MSDKYEGLTDDLFDKYLESIVAGMHAYEILSIPGVYEILREELNNKILLQYESQEDPI